MLRAGADRKLRQDKKGRDEALVKGGALGGGVLVSQGVPGKQSGKYFSRHGRV